MFVPIVNTSISASWLILAIIAIRLVFTKMPKAMTCVLWGLVAVRLVCPFSVESPLSLIPSAETIPEAVLYMEAARQGDTVQFNGIEEPVIYEAVGEVVGETVRQVQRFDAFGTLFWLAGMTVMLFYAMVSYLQLRYRVMVSICERENIWICDRIDAPFILGLFRPRIYIPSEMAEEQAAYVIAHEQAHLSRRDHWWKPLGFLLLSVYWFNPLIWVAYVLLSRDIELACDEKVVRSMGIADKQAYSEALLACSVNRRMITACPVAFGEVGVKARVKSVLNYKKPAFWVIAGSVVICAVIAVCFLTDPAESDTGIDPMEAAEKAAGLQETAEEQKGSAASAETVSGEDEIQQSNTPEAYVGGDEDLVLARGGKLLPDDDPESFARIEGVYYKLYEDKNGVLRKEYDLGNRDQLKERLLETADQLVDGEFPVNQNGESYGDRGLSQFVGYDPELVTSVGTNGRQGYVRDSEVAALVVPPASECPHEFLVNLYESDGETVIGEFPVSCGGHFSGNGMAVEETKELLAADPSALIEQTTLTDGDFPRNSNGETYGNALMAEALGRKPDLQAAVGTEGQAGYVRTADLDGPKFQTPQEALAWQQTLPAESYIPLYDFQGNEIGTFLIESKILSAAEKEALKREWDR